MIELLQYDFMVRALIAAALVGLAAPVIGVFIVQRRLALLGDGIGHVALTGVGLGFLTGNSPVLTALVVAVVGAVLIELVRVHTRTSGDLALALLFYGGIAGGVFLTGLAPGASTATLTSFLFGSVSTVDQQDVYVVAVLAAAVLAVLAYFGRELFVLCQDEEVARAHGLPVRFLGMVIAVVAAVTVVIAMRVVGALLVSALMVVPVAAAQQLTRSFRVTTGLAMLIGVLSALTGLSAAFYTDTAPGSSIVLIAIAVFAVASGAGAVLRARRGRRSGAGRDARAEPMADTISATDPGSIST
ncbi:metal ABC transporter permease [Actinorugispora endophytica]|uniref:Zinc transport system permease protein n=1 Tax=Actinorugispora endophytica TaxID=1605990 RepID=A0A4R6V1W6_9ACTN|nr:metal ABC transporter permease [Actinorugispora endophytica]TDQ52042.1 zinc transport system permease protein [Actinorugispora endophytica]